jgi:hypothetical protein
VLGFIPFRYDEAKDKWIRVDAMLNAKRSLTMMLSAPSLSSSSLSSLSSLSLSTPTPTPLNDIIMIGCESKMLGSYELSLSYNIFERYSSHNTTSSTAMTADNDNGRHMKKMSLHKDGSSSRVDNDPRYDNGQLMKWSSSSISTWLWMISMNWMDALPSTQFHMINNEWLLIPSFAIEGSSLFRRCLIVNINNIGDRKKWRWYEQIPRSIDTNPDHLSGVYLVISGHDSWDGHSHRYAPIH